MTIKEEKITVNRPPALAAAGGLIAALAASSCCIFPLLLFGLGVSGAWISNFTQLAPYEPYFVAVALAFLSYGYWLVYRSRTGPCREGEVCVRPMPNRIVLGGLVLATALVVIALGLNFIPDSLLMNMEIAQ